MSRFVLIGNLDSNRVAFFQAALAGLDLPPACLVSWADLLAGRVHLGAVVTPGARVRIESPGKDFDVERALLMRGADLPDEEGDGCDRLSRGACEALRFDKGRIVCPRQWYLGFRDALGEIARQLSACPPHAVMNAPDEIAAMFDKPLCHQALSQGGLPVPPALGPVRSYSELTARMAASGCRRVFVKPAHGSSASGVVAYQTDGHRHQAVTTVETAAVDGRPHLYNSRRLTTYRDASEIARLVDALARGRVHVERWLPKAGLADRTFDLRVVVIGGRARHAVARSSRSPITNLHLLNKRGDVGAVRDRMGEAAWADAMAACERAMRLFPRSHYAGLDLLIAPDFRRHAVLEVNAFGDLLPRALDSGDDTYAAEVKALCSTPTP